MKKLEVKQTPSIDNTLAHRQLVHGHFPSVAKTSQILRSHLIQTGEPTLDEALNMICSKLARITNGDPYEIDHWHDIAGYATLVVNRLNETNKVCVQN